MWDRNPADPGYNFHVQSTESLIWMHAVTVRVCVVQAAALTVKAWRSDMALVVTQLCMSPVKRSFGNEEIHMGNACIFKCYLEFSQEFNFFKKIELQWEISAESLMRQNVAKMKMNVKCWQLVFGSAQFFSSSFFCLSRPFTNTHTPVYIYTNKTNQHFQL